jgi:hypothetical protein
MRLRPIAFLFILTLLTGCKNPFSNPFSNPFGGGDDDSQPSVQPTRVTQPTQKFAVAVGGVYPGRDELVLYDEYGNVRHFVGDPLDCESSDEAVVKVAPRPGFDTQSAGSGVKIIALSPGIASISCAVGDIAPSEVYEVTVPPQSLVQIQVAEAGQQIADEAELDPEFTEENVVKLTSISKTANAIASVVRNRIELTLSEDDATLFGAEGTLFEDDPPASYYDEIIMADGQFSPTDAGDPMNDVFRDAESRDYLGGSWLTAYDQAVLTAAGVFNGDIEDPTGVSFAFYSPTDDEWESIGIAWSQGAASIPDGTSFTDATFPKLAPIQLLIHPDVWTYSDGRPSFLFARSRGTGDAAIANTP